MVVFTHLWQCLVWFGFQEHFGLPDPKQSNYRLKKRECSGKFPGRAERSKADASEQEASKEECVSNIENDEGDF